jgi:2-polyprenyl-6-hydroxyphenyl methylase/3-demethylubiquinone-9 3-methyltransferase|tara:strand:+ start:2533 stop:3261 length:729 start_codon:yes stop_codon:yes gene_type:complete
MAINTINKEEIQKFSNLAEEWWDPNGKFKPLHKFNPIRIKYIKNTIIKQFKIKNKIKPFLNLEILDIGCGGGLLTEPMTRLGGKLTGIDASNRNINIAKIHAKKNNLKINYFCSSPEKIKSKKKYDIILNMEIVEHVDDLNLFIKSSSSLLKKNGIMFIATINKTLKSYLFAIIGAEYVLNWLPVGTHDWFKFVEPDDLEKLCKKNLLRLIEINGLNYNLINNKWNLTKNVSVNYITVFKKD